jgi:hypothetical protein
MGTAERLLIPQRPNAACGADPANRKYFFTPLKEALRGLPDFVGLIRNGKVRMALVDTGALIKELARRPTHVS